MRRFPRAALLRVASDESLVELVRGGSEAAFEAIYDRHHRGILAFCRHMLSSPHEAEDAVQHTFMAAYRHLGAGDAQIQLRPWLYAIARNRCLSMLRARRERPLADYEEPATEHLSSEAQRRQDVRELLGDVARLPEEQRAALVLAELGAVSHDEIALVLEVPRQKVKALVFQARSSLAASRKARETPCAEIREQLANLHGGALRRTTLHRHVRECAGCRAFRDEVALQRKTLAIALPVVPSLGLKEAVLGAAFGGGGGGGAAAAASGGALAAKALVAVALVGGGTTAGVEVSRHIAAPRAAERSAPALRPHLRPAAAPAGRDHVVRPRLTSRGHAKPAEPKPASPRSANPAGAQSKPGKPADKPELRSQAKQQGQAKATPPGQANQTEQAKVPPDQAKAKAMPPGQAKAKAVPPGQAKAEHVPPGQAKANTVPPGRAKAKAVPPGQAKKQPAEPAAPLVVVPVAEPVLKAHGELR